MSKKNISPPFIIKPNTKIQYEVIFNFKLYFSRKRIILKEVILWN